ncbi:MAG: DUF3006 domain-containing protein [Clostridia bacterium]|nr:DUF3006 domain-containing protein [Clostridia bacterium]
MRFVIDRLEEDFAICENEETGEMEEIDVFLLPDGVEEGDILVYDEDLDEYYIDYEEKKIRKARIEDRMEDIWEEESMIETEE